MRKYSISFFLVMFLIGTDTFLISPLLPTLTALYHNNSSRSGWMISAYAIGYAIFALISGPFSDGRNRKKIMLFGLLAFAISTFLCVFANHFILMLLFRFLAGVSASFVTPQVWASIPVVAKKEKIMALMGIASAGLAVSQIAGVSMGSWLATISWHTPFLVISALTIVMISVVSVILPDMSHQTQKQKGISPVKIYADLLKNKRALQFLLGFLIFQIGNFSVFSFLGVWLAADFNLTVGQIGNVMIITGLGQFVMSLFAGKLTGKIGTARTLLIGILALIVLYVFLPMAHTLPLITLILTIIFAFNGFVFPVFIGLAQSTTTTARSTIAALSNAAMYLGVTIAGIIGGKLFEHFQGMYGISYFTILVYFVMLAVYWWSGELKNKNS